MNWNTRRKIEISTRVKSEREKIFIFKKWFSVKVNALCAQRMRGGSQLFHFFDGLLNALGLFSKRKKKPGGYYYLFFSLSWLSASILPPSSDSPPAPLWPRSPFVARLFFLQGFFFFFFLSSRFETFLSSFSKKIYIYKKKVLFLLVFLPVYIFPLAPQGPILSTSLTKGSFLPRANFGQGY
jgi:hypothetical protein